MLFSSNCITSITNDTIISYGNAVQLNASGGISYSWDPPEGLSSTNIANPVAAPDTTTTYHVLIVSDSCITTDTVTVTVLPLGVNPLLEEKSLLNIYPNPFQDYTTITIENFNIDELFLLEIFDSKGLLVRSQHDIGRGMVRIERGNLSRGLYFVKLIRNKEVFDVVKLVVE